MTPTYSLANDHFASWSDKTICRLAKTTPDNVEYQAELTRRGLSCGGAVTSSSSNNSSINTNSVGLSPIQIMLLQQHLKTEYLYNGAIDGRTSNKLIAALNEIAKKFGLTSNPSLSKEFFTEVLYRYGKIDLRKAVATGWSLDNTFNPVLGLSMILFNLDMI